jgi:hypothetical protein
MTMGCTVRQVEDVIILDLNGKLSLGEALGFRPGQNLQLSDAVSELAGEGHRKILLTLAV